MTAMIDPDVMTPDEIAEAEADEWESAIRDQCGHLCRDHDDGECIAKCPICHDLGYYYPSGDPADDREPCPCAGPKE